MLWKLEIIKLRHTRKVKKNRFKLLGFRVLYTNIPELESNWNTEVWAWVFQVQVNVPVIWAKRPTIIFSGAISVLDSNLGSNFSSGSNSSSLVEPSNRWFEFGVRLKYLRSKWVFDFWISRSRPARICWTFTLEYGVRSPVLINK